MIFKSLVRYERMDEPRKRKVEPIIRGNKTFKKIKMKRTSMKVDTLSILKTLGITAVTLVTIASLLYFAWLAVSTFIGGIN